MKIPEIYLKSKKDPGLVDFMDYASVILNQGLYQMRTINTVPSWVANEGESLLYSSGGIRRCYYYIDSAWRYIQWSSTSSSLSSIEDTDADTKIQLEEAADEDIIRFDTRGTERMVIGVTGDVNVSTGSFYTNVGNIYATAGDIYATAGDIYATAGDIAVASNSKILFDTTSGDTYWKYNSVTDYLEGWVSGVKRIEL